MDEEENKNLSEESSSDSETVVEDQDTASQDEGQDDQSGKRSAEGRIHELLSKNKELEEKMGRLEDKVNNQPVPTPPVAPKVPDESVTPEVKEAIDLLKSRGKFVDEDDLKEQIKGIQDRMYLDSQHQRLENQLSGADGRPSYNRGEVEEYMRQQGVWNPEAAYKLMHEAELFDWTVKKAEGDRKKKPYVNRPSSSGGEREDKTISRDKVEEVVKNPTPENRAWYENHRKEILELYGKGLL